MKATKETVRQPIITVSIVPGPVSEYQKRLWSKFWRKLVSEAKSEAQK